MIFKLNNTISFPNPALAEEDGLLAFGGDLSTERLILAYQQGIFPWYSEGEPILWYSPHQRFVLFPNQIVISKSMRKLMLKARYQVKWNTDFTQVINLCAQVKRKAQSDTWITDNMLKAYMQLHQMGIAQSVEVWENEKLVGGLYGIKVGGIFCGESMFSLQPNTSKLALIALCQSNKFELIDCQIYTEHLYSMGAKLIAQAQFLEMLRGNKI